VFKVVAPENGVEINGHYVGPKEQGFASATEHFGQYLALLARDDRRKREDGALPRDLMARWVAAMRRFDVPPGQGLTHQEASAAFRENGLDPRSSGSWAMQAGSPATTTGVTSRPRARSGSPSTMPCSQQQRRTPSFPRAEDRQFNSVDLPLSALRMTV
jgi:hypothetical protein